MIPGRGVSTRVDGHAVLAGNEQLLKEHTDTFSDELPARASSWLDEGCTVIYVAVDGKAAGFLVLADTSGKTLPKPSARSSLPAYRPSF